MCLYKFRVKVPISNYIDVLMKMSILANSLNANHVDTGMKLFFDRSLVRALFVVSLNWRPPVKTETGFYDAKYNKKRGRTKSIII